MTFSGHPKRGPNGVIHAPVCKGNFSVPIFPEMKGFQEEAASLSNLIEKLADTTSHSQKDIFGSDFFPEEVDSCASRTGTEGVSLLCHNFLVVQRKRCTHSHCAGAISGTVIQSPSRYPLQGFASLLFLPD
jgi:hypothetical protein